MLISSLTNSEEAELDIDPDNNITMTPIIHPPQETAVTSGVNAFDDVFEPDTHIPRHHTATTQGDPQDRGITARSDLEQLPATTNPQPSPPSELRGGPSSPPHADDALPPRSYYSHAGEVSDVPRLQATHSTAGYRDGIAAAKSRFVQDGFDEGFALSAEVGRRVGWILGVLEGVVRGLERAAVVAAGAGSGSGTASSGLGRSEGALGEVSEQLAGLGVEGGLGSSGSLPDNPLPGCGARLEQLVLDSRSRLEEARKELTVEKVFGEEYMHPDALWKYPVPVEGDSQDQSDKPANNSPNSKTEDEDSIISFAEVAAAHPLVIKWERTVRVLEQEINADFEAIAKRLDGNRDVAESDA